MSFGFFNFFEFLRRVNVIILSGLWRARWTYLHRSYVRLSSQRVLRLGGITILFVKFKGFFDGLRQFNAKFMGPFQITRIPLSHKKNNAGPLPQDVRNPPDESWFMVNSKDLACLAVSIG
jgi:hypothetical protein